MAETTRRGKTPIVLLVLGLLLAIPVGAWLLRGTIATSMAREELTRQGITCDDRFGVDVGALFGSATIGPTRCTRESGIVEAMEILGPLTVDLEGLEPAAIRAESVRLVLRDRQVNNGDGWAPALARLRVEHSVAGLVKGLSEVSTMELPPIDAGHVEVTRGGEAIATGSGISLAQGSPMEIGADRIVFASPIGVGRLELTAVTGTATRPRVQLAGHGSASMGAGLLGVLSTGGRFSLDARGLDTASPRFSLRL